MNVEDELSQNAPPALVAVLSTKVQPVKVHPGVSPPWPLVVMAAPAPLLAVLPATKQFSMSRSRVPPLE